MVNDTVRRTVFDACRPEWLRIDGDVYTWEMEFSMPVGLSGFESNSPKNSTRFLFSMPVGLRGFESHLHNRIIGKSLNAFGTF